VKVTDQRIKHRCFYQKFKDEIRLKALACKIHCALLLLTRSPSEVPTAQKYGKSVLLLSYSVFNVALPTNISCGLGLMWMCLRERIVTDA